MAFQILLDPDATEGGGAPPAEPARGGEPIAVQRDAGSLADEMLGQLTDAERNAPLNGIQETEEAAARGGGTPAAAAAPPPADPNLAAAVKPAAAPAATEFESIREVAGRFGVDLSQFPDDQAALFHLLSRNQAASQNDYYTQLGRQLAPQAPAIQQYLQAQKPAAAATRPAWEPPEFDERWLSQIKRDETTGIITALPGVNPIIAEKVQAYADWKTAYDRNPAAVISQMVDHRAQEIAQKAISEQFAQHTQQQTISNILNQNAAWFYAQDEQGQVRRDFAGKPMTSPLGARYITHIRSLGAAGMKDPAQLDTFARQLLQADIAAQTATAATQTAQTQRPQATGAVARANTNPGQAAGILARGVTPGATEPDQEHMSLAERLMAEMKAGGVTDADFAQVA